MRGGGKACMVGSGGVCVAGGACMAGSCVAGGGVARTRPESLLFELCPLAREGSILRGSMLISDF